MTAKRRASTKKPTDTYELLAARVTGYELRIEAGLNKDLKGNSVCQSEPDDPLYTYRTLIQLWGEFTWPETHAGETYDFLIVGDAHADDLKLTLADIQVRDRYGSPKSRLYRGVRIPVYGRPL